MSSRTNLDDGSLAPAIAVLGVSLLLLAGLVSDGARVLAAHARATAVAEEAARAGAQQIDTTSADAQPRVLPELARASVIAYCDTAGTLCSVLDADSRHVVVRATVALPPGLLGLVHPAQFAVSGTANARPVAGVVAGSDAGSKTSNP
jgi:Flp pilus assembly protein TadG